MCFLLNISRIFYTLSTPELLREKSKVWLLERTERFVRSGQVERLGGALATGRLGERRAERPE